MPVEYWTYTDKALRQSIRNNKLRLAEHEEKLKNPAAYAQTWKGDREKYLAGAIKHWNTEIENLKTQILLAEEELRRRGGK